MFVRVGTGKTYVRAGDYIFERDFFLPLYVSDREPQLFLGWGWGGGFLSFLLLLSYIIVAWGLGLALACVRACFFYPLKL